VYRKDLPLRAKCGPELAGGRHLHLSQSDWSRRRRSCSAPGDAEIISVNCTAAFGVLIVARLSRDDFAQIAVQRVSIPIDIGLCLVGRADQSCQRRRSRLLDSCGQGSLFSLTGEIEPQRGEIHEVQAQRQGTKHRQLCFNSVSKFSAHRSLIDCVSHAVGPTKRQCRRQSFRTTASLTPRGRCSGDSKPCDFFFESGDINHTVFNKTDAPMVHVLFEIRPVNLNGPSLSPVGIIRRSFASDVGVANELGPASGTVHLSREGTSGPL
jgi:hypothetical protein